VAHSYLFCALVLSGTADLVVVVARVFGWHLPHSFRWALLAWNPVELWRRWAIYNRRLLLTLVYFPLGGSERRRTLNVLLTFLASGLVLHSGWVGSKYWELGVGGWRDQSAYFLIQGLAVCGCLWFWRLTGKDPRSDRELRWSAPRVLGALATQAFSAWVHILVLAPQLEWSERWHLMARCLGLGRLL
jgi:D-alanyl-lipoteichoic acid acyltransferase DltB (MBOAT superfamily)